MLDKKQFIKIMTDLKLLDDLRKLDKDFGGLRLSRVGDLVLDVLEIVMEDKKNCWISYYTRELNWGENYKDGCITNGKNIPLKTFEDLYNILTKK